MSFDQLLRYEPETGLFFWRESRGPVKAGSQAGNIRLDGYIAIKFDGKSRKAHRLAWFVMHGVWPPDEIDHINGVKSDNRISNLRLATRSQNQHNRRKRRDNTSGYKGVCWVIRDRKWAAVIRLHGKPISLGHFNTSESAHAAYCDAAEKYHGEFARPA